MCTEFLCPSLITVHTHKLFPNQWNCGTGATCLQSCGKCSEANTSRWLHSDSNTLTGSFLPHFSCLFTLQKMAVSLSHSSPYTRPAHYFIYLCHFSARPALRFLYLQYKLLILFATFCICLCPQVLRTLLHLNGFLTWRHILCCPSPVWKCELTIRTALHYRSNTPSNLQFHSSVDRNTETKLSKLR
jgi:hypothetical protein